MADLDVLRAAYRESWTGDESAHLAEDTWVLLASDGLAAGESDDAIDHILECPRCARTYRALLAVRDGAGAFDPDAPPETARSDRASSVKPGWWGGLSVLALAACVVLAIYLPSRTPTGSIDGSETTAVRSASEGFSVIPVVPVDEIVDRPATGDVFLRWETSDQAGPFEVEILDAEGELVWTSPPTSDSETVWPDGATAPPGRYYWRVLSVGPAQRGLASDLVSFDLVDEGVSANPP